MARVTMLMMSIGVVSFIMLAMGLFVTNLASDYGLDYDNETIQQFDKYTEIRDASKTLKENVESATTRKSSLGQLQDILGGLVTRVWSSIALAGTSFSVLQGMIVSSQDYLGLGSTAGRLVDTLVLFIVIGLISGLIFLIMKVKG